MYVMLYAISETSWEQDRSGKRMAR